MTRQERDYLRYLIAKRAEYAEAQAQEHLLAPRDYTDRTTWECRCAALRFLRNLEREERHRDRR